MEQNQHEEFKAALAAVHDFYGKSVSPFAANIWWDTCRRYSLEDVTRAFSAHCQDPDRGQWMPKPADIKRLLEGGSGDQSLRAWSRVDKAVREVGPYQTLVFDDHRIHAVIDDMGGWIRLCDCPSEEEFVFLMHEFRKRYQGYVMRQPSAWPGKLIGRTEAECRRMGREDAIPEPMLLGDPQRAVLVMERAKERQREALPLSAALNRLPAA